LFKKKYFLRKVNMTWWRQNWYKISLALLFIWAFFLRCYHLGETSIWMDEGYSINAAMSIWQKGWPILDSGRYYLGGIIYHYLLAGLYGISGGNIFGMRLLSVIIGMAGSGVLFKTAQKITRSNQASIWTLLLYWFGYWQIAWSRQIRMYELTMLFLWLSVYFFWQVIEKGKDKWKKILVSLTFLVLATLCHPVVLLVGPVYLLIFWLFFPDPKSKKSITIWLLGLVLLWQIIGYFTIYRNLTLFYLIKNNLSLNFYLPSFLEFIGNSYLWQSVLSLIAVVWFIIENKHSRQTWFLALTYLFPLTIFCFFFRTLIFRYLFVFTPALLILNGMFITEILAEIKKKNVAYLSIATLFALMIYSGELVVWPKTFYKLESNPENSSKTYLSYTPQPNFATAYQTMRAQLAANDAVVSAYPHLTKILLGQPGYWLKFDYIGAEKSDYYVDSNNREYYVNAETINNLDQLKELNQIKTVFIIYDRMARDRLDGATLDWIEKNGHLLFFDQTNIYSQVWVWQINMKNN